MRTILIYTSPARGHLYPMMDVALALRDRGHRVVVQTLAGEGERVRAAGLEPRPLDPGIEAIPLEDFRAGTPVAQLRRTFDCWLRRAPLEVRDLERSCEELTPDLLLVDANTWGAAALAEGRGRPWAMFLPYCLPVPSRDAPAFGPGFPPPRGPLGRLRDRWVWRVLARSTRAEVAALNQLRHSLGVPALATHGELFQRPPLLLYRTAEPFEYPRSDWPEPLEAIGPGLWAPEGEAPGWLAELPRPRVLVSVSTEHQDDGAIIRAALEGLGRRSANRGDGLLEGGVGSLIVTTAALDPAGFPAPHDRVRIVRFLPHAAVIPEVDVVVTHGGMGTTQRALAAGVPVCVVPWGRDQAESARRVEVAGAGTRVPRARLTPARLRAGVQEALRRGGGARGIARAFEAAGGAPRAADLLEGLLEGAPSGGHPSSGPPRSFPRYSKAGSRTSR